MVWARWGSALLFDACHAACTASSVWRLTARGAPGSAWPRKEAAKQGKSAECHAISRSPVLTKSGKYAIPVVATNLFLAGKFAPEAGEVGALGDLEASEAGALELPTATTWGRAETLADHFARHGADFGAKTADEYASMASRFLQESQAAKLPTKIDSQGVIRIFDSETGTFGSFNPNGTTRTFFKPSSPTYFDRQPGTLLP